MNNSQDRVDIINLLNLIINRDVSNNIINRTIDNSNNTLHQNAHDE